MQGSITTLTLNPALDRTVVVPGFTPGSTNRAQRSRIDPGGKGINVARVAQALGAPVRVLGLLGTRGGEPLTQYLTQQEIPWDFVPVPGETRVNLKIIDPETAELTEVNDAGFAVTPEHLAALTARVQAALPHTRVLVLAGSLPPGVPPTYYRDLVALARQADVATIVDADGPALAHALDAGPTLIKPNQAEAEGLLGHSLQSREQLVRAGEALRSRGAERVVISTGAAGALLTTAQGSWWATPPSIQARSTVGAGDSMVAGLALALVRGLNHEEALRLATAAGAATAAQEGTQLGSAADVDRLVGAVRLHRLEFEI